MVHFYRNEEDAQVIFHHTGTNSIYDTMNDLLWKSTELKSAGIHRRIYFIRLIW